jgi:hypothetical protein
MAIDSHSSIANVIESAAYPLSGAADDYDSLLRLIGDAQYVLLG